MVDDRIKFRKFGEFMSKKNTNAVFIFSLMISLIISILIGNQAMTDSKSQFQQVVIRFEKLKFNVESDLNWRGSAIWVEPQDIHLREQVPLVPISIHIFMRNPRWLATGRGAFLTIKNLATGQVWQRDLIKLKQTGLLKSRAFDAHDGKIEEQRLDYQCFPSELGLITISGPVEISLSSVAAASNIVRLNILKP